MSNDNGKKNEHVFTDYRHSCNTYRLFTVFLIQQTDKRKNSLGMTLDDDFGLMCSSLCVNKHSGQGFVEPWGWGDRKRNHWRVELKEMVFEVFVNKSLTILRNCTVFVATSKQHSCYWA